MNPIKFKECNTVFAKDQPEYLQLPAYQWEETFLVSHNGRVTSCWHMSWFDRLKVLFTGKVWVDSLTSLQPLQPVKLSVDKPELGAEPEVKIEQLDTKA